jgi:hypothetical protein
MNCRHRRSISSGEVSMKFEGEIKEGMGDERES